MYWEWRTTALGIRQCGGAAEGILQIDPGFLEGCLNIAPAMAITALTGTTTRKGNAAAAAVMEKWTRHLLASGQFFAPFSDGVLEILILTARPASWSTNQYRPKMGLPASAAGIVGRAVSGGSLGVLRGFFYTCARTTPRSDGGASTDLAEV